MNWRNKKHLEEHLYDSHVKYFTQKSFQVGSLMLQLRIKMSMALNIA